MAKSASGSSREGREAGEICRRPTRGQGSARCHGPAAAPAAVEEPAGVRAPGLLAGPKRPEAASHGWRSPRKPEGALFARTEAGDGIGGRPGKGETERRRSGTDKTGCRQQPDRSSSRVRAAGTTAEMGGVGARRRCVKQRFFPRLPKASGEARSALPHFSRSSAPLLPRLCPASPAALPTINTSFAQRLPRFSRSQQQQFPRSVVELGSEIGTSSRPPCRPRPKGAAPESGKQGPFRTAWIHSVSSLAPSA